MSDDQITLEITRLDNRIAKLRSQRVVLLRLQRNGKVTAKKRAKANGSAVAKKRSRAKTRAAALNGVTIRPPGKMDKLHACLVQAGKQGLTRQEAIAAGKKKFGSTDSSIGAMLVHLKHADQVEQRDGHWVAL